MSATSAPGADNRRRRVVGWVAVALTVLVASSFAAFAGGELFMEEAEGFGWPAMLGHLAQAAPVVLIGIIAVRWPRIGGSLILLLGVGFLIVPAVVANSSEGIGAIFAALGYAAPVLVPIAAAGLLYFYGVPSRRKLTYALVVAVPVAFFALSALLSALIGTPAE